MIESGKPSTKRGSRVALHDHQIRQAFFEVSTDRCNSRGRQLWQGLVVLHQVEIHIRNDSKHLKYLIQHFAMLSSNANIRLEVLAILCQKNQRTELDRLRPCAEYVRDFLQSADELSGAGRGETQEIATRNSAVQHSGNFSQVFSFPTLPALSLYCNTLSRNSSNRAIAG